MFDSSRLSEQFKSKSEEIHPTEGHEGRIRLLYELQLNRQSCSKSRRRGGATLLKVSVAAIVLAMLSGFTGYYYFKMSDQKVSFTYKQPLSGLMAADTSVRIYGMLQQIETELKAGQSAIVYVPELADIYQKNLALVSVVRPATITNVGQWRAALSTSEQGAKLLDAMLPDLSSAGWTFDRGQRQRPFGGFISQQEHGWLAELRRESADAGGGASWRVRTPDSEDTVENVYSVFYRNKEQEELYVSLQIVDRRTDIQLMSSLVAAEAVDLYDKKAYFIRIEPFMFAESNMQQQVQWIESLDDTTWVFSVGSVLPEVAKSELLQVAGMLAQAWRHAG